MKMVEHVLIVSQDDCHTEDSVRKYGHALFGAFIHVYAYG